MSGRTESVFCKNKRNSGKGAGIGIPLRIPHINSICDLSAFHQKTNVFAFGKSGISETFEVGDGVLQSGLFQKEFNISFLTVGDNADSIIL